MSIQPARTSMRPPTFERRRSSPRARPAADRRVGSPFRHRCVGRPAFRSEAARDVALSLDLDPRVADWRCLPGTVRGRIGHDDFVAIKPDFLVTWRDGSVAAVDAEGIEGFEPLDPMLGYVDMTSASPLDDVALENLRGVACYADMPVPLADRIRLVALLREIGPATLTEAAAAASTPDPFGTVLALAAQGAVDIDWRSAVIGPDTIVRLPEHASAAVEERPMEMGR